MLLGAFILNYIQSMPTHPSDHKLLAFSSVCIVISNCIFISSNSFFYQGLLTFIAAISYFLLETLVDICTINLNENVETFILLINGCAGIGAMIGPILLLLMGESSYFLFSIILAATIPAFLILPSPDRLKE
jgi:hypothetical protein